VSPFAHANRIERPLLLIHGANDSNSGTYPLQSERLFQAIQGHGGTARLVVLPFEDHGYRSRESIMHVIAEMFEWTERYASAPEPAEAAAD
jgi:dipeptidyl aminopeptidase/acylaminoacyl peptidase